MSGETYRYTGRGTNGEGFPHVLHECASAQLTNHRLDHSTPATIVSNSSKQKAQHSESVVNEEESESFSSEEDHSTQMKALLKGKAKVAADFQFQS